MIFYTPSLVINGKVIETRSLSVGQIANLLRETVQP